MDNEVQKFIQPQIVAIGEGYDLDNIYIACEGKILCSIPQESIIDSIVALLSSFYVFNIVYKESKAILSFLEQALMGIGRGHTLLTVNTFFNDISNVQWVKFIEIHAEGFWIVKPKFSLRNQGGIGGEITLRCLTESRETKFHWFKLTGRRFHKSWVREIRIPLYAIFSVKFT